MQMLFFRGVLFLALASGKLAAAVPGAWEQFHTMRNAFAWRVYDYADGSAYFPEWDSSTAGQEYIWLRHDGDEPLEFSADAGIANGALVGNYTAANVKEISCEVFIESLADFDALDCSVLTKRADGVERWYYSQPYVRANFTGNGWWQVIFGFKENWSYSSGTMDIRVMPDASFMASIKEVSVTFFPRTGVTANRKAAIDNVILEPEVTPPAMTTGTASGGFQLAFTPAPGLSADLQMMSASAPFTWSDVAGHTLVTGPAVHAFSTPRDARVKIYRALVFPDYRIIATP